MIEISNLSFSYDEKSDNGKKAIDEISLTINDGEFVGIIGPAGAGKSTFTMCLNGIVPHYFNGSFYGAVMVDGTDTVDSSCVMLSKIVGSVLQDPELQIATSIVEDEIAFGLENINFPAEQIEERVTEALELAGISYLRKRKTNSLSGGQLQRVAVACAVAQRPKILVLDEPTSELDPEGSVLIFNTLKKLNEQYNMTIIIVEQKVMLLSQYCSRIIAMNNGKVVLDETARKLQSRYTELESLGVNCPRIVTLAAKLKAAGVYDGEYPLNVDEAYQMINSVIMRLAADKASGEAAAQADIFAVSDDKRVCV